MKIRRASLKDCDKATDTVIVIDVLRAFTTAAYAFEAGAKEIILVSTIEEAFEIKHDKPHVQLMGEEHGLPIEGFNFGNSPSELASKRLDDLVLVQRTSAGTQGVVRSKGAKRLFATGLCNAAATVKHLNRFQPRDLVLVETGVTNEDGGVDDTVCADYIEALILNKSVDKEKIIQQVWQAPASLKFMDESLDSFPRADLECAVKIDQFDFTMKVSWENGYNYLRKVVL